MNLNQRQHRRNKFINSLFLSVTLNQTDTAFTLVCLLPRTNLLVVDSFVAPTIADINDGQIRASIKHRKVTNTA